MEYPTEPKLLCGLCLSADRTLIRFNSIPWAAAFLQEFYVHMSSMICWECRATLWRFSKFRGQAARAAEILRCGYLGTIKCLSSLSVTAKSSYDKCYDQEEVFNETVVEPKIEPDCLLMEESAVKYEDSADEVWVNPIYPDTENDEENVIKPEPTAADINLEIEFESVRPPKKCRKSLKTVKMKIKKKPKPQDCGEHCIKKVYRMSKTYKCEMCCKNFNSSEEYLAHDKENHVEKFESSCRCSFKLGTPQSEAIISDTIPKRSRKDRQKTRHKCEFCDKSFSKLRNLRHHVLIHTSTDVYECDTCHKKFNTRNQIVAHMYVHTLRRQCDVCGKRVTDEKKLKQHYFVHLDTSQREHECNICHKRFIDRWKLNIHSRVHTGEKPYKCAMCEEAFIRKPQLDRHIKKDHNIGPLEPKKPRVTPLFRKKRHEAGDFICKLCGKAYATEKYLEIHYGNHRNDLPHKCDQCNKTFKFKSVLKKHKMRHAGEKVHPCNVCGARFAIKEDLGNHMKSHSDEKNYKCDICDLRFKYYSGLWSHKQLHKGEKAHQCNICGARFTLKGNLNGHMKTHTNEKPYQCDVCGMKFPWRRNLKNHYKTHAEEQKVFEMPPEIISRN